MNDDVWIHITVPIVTTEPAEPLLQPLDAVRVPPVVVDVDRPLWQQGLDAHSQVPRDMKDDRSLVRPLLEEQAFALVRGPNSLAKHVFDLAPVRRRHGNSYSSGPEVDPCLLGSAPFALRREDRAADAELSPSCRATASCNTRSTPG